MTVKIICDCCEKETDSAAHCYLVASDLCPDCHEIFHEIFEPEQRRLTLEIKSQAASALAETRRRVRNTLPEIDNVTPIRP